MAPKISDVLAGYRTVTDEYGQELLIVAEERDFFVVRDRWGNRIVLKEQPHGESKEV